MYFLFVVFANVDFMNHIHVCQVIVTYVGNASVIGFAILISDQNYQTLEPSESLAIELENRTWSYHYEGRNVPLIFLVALSLLTKLLCFTRDWIFLLYLDSFTKVRYGPLSFFPKVSFDRLWFRKTLYDVIHMRRSINRYITFICLLQIRTSQMSNSQTEDSALITLLSVFMMKLNLADVLEKFVMSWAPLREIHRWSWMVHMLLKLRASLKCCPRS